MRGVSNRRVVRIALAASLAVHLIFAALIHPNIVRADDGQEPTPLPIVHLIPPPPLPAPLPRVHRARTQHRAAHVSRPAMHPPKLPPRHETRGPVAIAPSRAPTGDPQPPDVTAGPGNGPTGAPQIATPTPKPACSAPDVPARTLEARSPDEPEDTRASGITGTAKVRVDLDASGQVLSASVYESSGSMELDRAALEAARASTYAPEERNCKNVAGAYLFTVDFQ